MVRQIMPVDQAKKMLESAPSAYRLCWNLQQGITARAVSSFYTPVEGGWRWAHLHAFLMEDSKR